MPCQETCTGVDPLDAPAEAVYAAMREATVEVSMAAELIVAYNQIDKIQRMSFVAEMRLLSR